MTNRYHQQLQALHNAIIKQDSSAVTPLISLARHNEISTSERLDIYAKGYHLRLAQATLNDYPALAHLIGEEKLKQYINDFTHQVTSNNWDLNLYPSRFADFFKKASSDISAIELCQLEAAISFVYWQPATTTLSVEQVMQLDEEAFGNSRFTLHAGSRLLTLNADAESYLAAFRESQPLDKIPQTTHHMLITRPHTNVMRYSLDQHDFEILNALQKGLTFNEAIASIKDQATLSQHLSRYVSQWFEREIFMTNEEDLTSDI